MAKGRNLYVVSTDRKDLYDLLKKQFANDENVEVILNRRKGEVRKVTSGTKAERHSTERRLADEAHLLKTLGVIVVSRDPDEAEAKEGAKATRRGKGA